MSDWEIRRNADGTIDEIVAHGVDIHLEQTDKNAWSFNVYAGDNNAPFLGASIYSKKKVTVFVDEGQDVYPVKAPSMENLSKIEGDLEAVAEAVEAVASPDIASQTPQVEQPEFIKFPSGAITL